MGNGKSYNFHQDILSNFELLYIIIINKVKTIKSIMHKQSHHMGYKHHRSNHIGKATKTKRTPPASSRIQPPENKSIPEITINFIELAT